MKRTQTLLLITLAVVTLGSLAGTLGYAGYLRSARYRLRCAEYLSERLDLPSDIGRVVPRSFTSREFDDVVVWLPDRRGKALTCRRAVVHADPTREDPGAYEIELLGGSCEISSRTWLREDYRRVLESGLRPGFDPEGPRRVRFSGMNLRFEREEFAGELSDAFGVVEFRDPEHGWAAVHCRGLNGYESHQALALTAEFSPRREGICIDALRLRVPTLPLPVLRLDRLLGIGLQHGSFDGELNYSETDGHRTLTLKGRCNDLELAECTAGLLPAPWRGRGTEIELRELTLRDGRPVRLRFAGALEGLFLGDVLAPWGLRDLGGELTLRVREAEFSGEGIDRLIASGRCLRLDLEALTGYLGWGRMSGTARLVIDDLTMERNRLHSLAARFQVEDRRQPEWMEGRLLANLASRLFHLDLPDFLPDRIAYTHLGFKAEVQDERLTLFGTHGPREKTILTVRLFDRELPLLREPEAPIDLSELLDRWRDQARDYLATWREASPQQTWDALRRWPWRWWPSSRPGPSGGEPGAPGATP